MQIESSQSEVTANSRQPLSPTIEAVNLTKVFGKRVCVDHLNFKVHAGELYALLGDNGAGKTTTLNMLTTLLAPTEGEFFICGHHGWNQQELAKSAFGVVSQDVSIYQELTAWENLAFIAELYGMSKQKATARIKELLDEAGLSERANDQAGEYSTGMQRKLSIACAILPEPQVLFMDEPTVGLDPASRRQIWTSLRELRANGVTVLLTTHYLEEAELLADRIGIIRKGRLVLEGTIDELRDKIQSIRSISVRIAKGVSIDGLKEKFEVLAAEQNTRVKYDQLRNTVSLAQPKHLSLGQFAALVVRWFESQKIEFSKFVTSEPNLEEVFLEVTSGNAEIELDVDDLNGQAE
jgi:ABC-2 type transport system ATP-binding protein